MGVAGNMQADNDLYTTIDAANELQHKSVTMNNTETSNGGSNLKMRFKVDRDKCRRCALLLWGGCVTGLVVLALAGAAVALAIIFTGFVDVCAKSCPTQGECGEHPGEMWLLIYYLLCVILALVKLLVH